jgi:hypothetical protein
MLDGLVGNNFEDAYGFMIAEALKLGLQPLQAGGVNP